jgi:hypothetical protein
MWPRVDGLRAMELGAPGGMRQWLNGLVLAGRKRATAGLLDHDYVAEGKGSNTLVSGSPCWTTAAARSQSSR